jgi:hypothetical protein
MKADYFTYDEAKLAKKIYLKDKPDLDANIKQSSPGSDYYRIWVFPKDKDYDFGTIQRSQVNFD